MNMFKSNLSQVFKDGGTWETKDEKDSYEMNKWTLQFKSQHVERQFRLEYIENHITIMRFCIWLLWTLLLLWTVIEALMLGATLQYTLMRVIATVAFTVVAIYTMTDSFYKIYQDVTLVLIILILFAKFGMEVIFLNEGGLASSFVPILTFVLFNIGFMKICLINLLHMLLFMTSLILWAAFQPFSRYEALVIIVSYTVLMIGITLTCALIGYWIEHTERREF
jgi:hypothetical protein